MDPVVTKRRSKLPQSTTVTFDMCPRKCRVIFPALRSNSFTAPPALPLTCNICMHAFVLKLGLPNKSEKNNAPCMSKPQKESPRLRSHRYRMYSYNAVNHMYSNSAVQLPRSKNYKSLNTISEKPLCKRRKNGWSPNRLS